MKNWQQWGTEIDSDCIRQMENACSLPITVRGALMPDAHTGYGLPIGGVLATEGAVVPYAVGMDIACRMKMSVFDWAPEDIRKKQDHLISALENETCFGVGNGFRQRKQHAVMDRDWAVSSVTGRLKDKAWDQLGSSGSGNHFAEFGVLTLERKGLGLAEGSYLALLTHSGSRGTGGEVCTYYSRLARQKHPELPRQLDELAWLDLKSSAGEEYWNAMELMGHYASANHELIHGAIARHLGARVIAGVENHHNFAWRERHFGKDVIVHRKGATPAGRDALGIIPGSMTAPGFVVRGQGNAESMNSAAHGAGRRMSRKAARRQYSRDDINKVLKAHDVMLLSADLDEAPMSYKNINKVMDEQSDLVEIIARFDPKIVKMAPPERQRGRKF